MNVGQIDSSNNFICKDVNGNTVIININSLSPFLLFNMDAETIAELRSQYLQLGGKLPITKKTVKELFNVNSKST